jgi:hypothetical protein
MRVSDNKREKIMKQHRLSTAAMTLMTVAAFIVTAWASSAVADDPAKLLRDLPERGLLFDVFLHERDRPGHKGMKIVVVQTETVPGVEYGLIFLQFGGGMYGKGIICKPLNLYLDGSLECEHKLEGYTETLRIGAIESNFCDDLSLRIHRDHPNRRTANGENPVATKAEECPHDKCICYDVKHAPPDDKGAVPKGPPNSGSGTGGHN